MMYTLPDETIMLQCTGDVTLRAQRLVDRHPGKYVGMRCAVPSIFESAGSSK